MIGVWWNADPGTWEHLLEGGRLDALLAGQPPAPYADGPVFMGLQDVSNLCRYHTELTIPADARPGTYQITVLDIGDGGAPSSAA